MTAVNLLPWREVRRQHARRGLLKVLTGLLALQLGAVTGMEALVNARRAKMTYTEQAQRTSLLALREREAAYRTLKQETERLMQRRQTLIERQRNIECWSDFWLKLGAMLPEELWLLTLEARQGQLRVQGLSQSVKAINDLYRRLEQHSLFYNLRQGAVIRNEQKTYRFVLTAFIREKQDVR